MIGAVKAVCRRHRFARVLSKIRMLCMKYGALSFTKHRDAYFVHRRSTDCIRMRDIDLLNSFIRQVTEPGQVRSPGLESREGLFQMMLFEIVIARQMLLLCDLVIDLYRKLVAGFVTQRHALKRVTSYICLWHKLL